MTRRYETRKKILRFIKEFRYDKGYAPTIREIARGCGVKSTSVVEYHLNHLEQAGLIARDRERFRSLRVTGETGERPGIPILGTIAAGHPIWVPSADRWSAEAQRRVDVPAEVTRGRKNVFALEVRGNSMVDAMIADGDMVIMEPVERPNNGDVVACWLRNEQEVTLKKIYFEGEEVRLQPCNPYMMPIYHQADNIEVQGRVVAVIRIHA